MNAESIERKGKLWKDLQQQWKNFYCQSPIL